MKAIELRNLKAHHMSALDGLLRGQRAEYAHGFRPFAKDIEWLYALEGVKADVYQGIRYADVLIGVLLLRGWDAGYTIPALGILVDECHAGKGLADAAIRMALCTARLRGCAKVMLHCDVDNVRARRCFARHCFAEVGRNGPVIRMEVEL